MIMVDSRKAPAHMTTDADLTELHRFALSIGLKKRWFQNKRIPHYDLTTTRKIDTALQNGAELVTPRELVLSSTRT